MSGIIAVVAEAQGGEKRIALVPETAKKFAALGFTLRLESKTGNSSNFADSSFINAQICNTKEETLNSADIILRVTPPSAEDIEQMPTGCILIGMLRPFESAERIAKLNEKNISAFALELLPRISRAQSMDALSSQGACSGYQCGLIAAANCSKFFPMLTTAAGTMRPAKVLVVGAGVAGLQAIATCKRLGAIVEAYDVRAEAKEQIESLGAKFVDTGVTASGSGGYARELNAEEKAQQSERLAKAVSAADVVITTAAIPGKAAPKIISEQMLDNMQLGAIVVDMAAESGGNCAATIAGQVVSYKGVSIHGPVNLPSRMPTHASELYARNLFNFISPWLNDGQINIDWHDEIITGSLLTKDGACQAALVRKVLAI